MEEIKEFKKVINDEKLRNELIKYEKDFNQTSGTRGIVHIGSVR